MILQRYKKKFLTLGKVLKFIYGRYTGAAIFRDISLVILTATEIYAVTILGKFIDEVANILLNWGSFDLTRFFETKAFLHLVVIFLCWSIVQICFQVKDYFYEKIYEGVWEDTRLMLISKVSRSNLQDVEQEKYQDLLAYVPAFSIDRIVLTYNNFSIVMSSLVRVVSAATIIFATMGWSVLLLVLFALPLTTGIHIRRKHIRKYQEENVGKLKFLNYVSNVALQISNFLELRVNDTFSFLRRRYNEEYDEYVGGYLKEASSYYFTRATFSIFGQFLKFGYIVYLLSFSIVRKLSLGSFKALYDYVDIAYNGIVSSFDSISYISAQVDYIDKFFDLIGFNGYGDIHHGEKKLKNGTPKIEFKHLDFAYPDDPKTKVIKDVNIVIEPGQKVAFFGGDGSGKSSMVKILTGLYQVVSGEYLVDDIPVRELDRGELKKKISVTFQDFVNYNFSLKENIVISGERKNVDKRLYKEISNISGVDDFMKKERIDELQILGKTFPGGKELSPGYWQRLAIARMMYRNRNIFIMDESFTFIDSTSKDTILQNTLDFVGKDRTLIYITRSIDNLEVFDKIYHFEHGKVVESGNLKELIKKKGKFAKLLKSNS